MAELFSISEIFDKRILRIPDFQRGFSWGERQLDDFWDDLEKVPQKKWFILQRIIKFVTHFFEVYDVLEKLNLLTKPTGRMAYKL